MLPEALYEADGPVLVPTALTRGPWNPDHQHAGPPSALLAYAVEAAAGIERGRLARIAIDILRPVPLAPLTLEARVVRPGRRVELVQAILKAADGGAELMRAKAWRIRDEAMALPDGLGDAAPPPPGPDGIAAAGKPSFWTDDVAYFEALEWRFAAGDFDAPGAATVWARVKVPLITGEPITPVERMLVMVDAASGVSAVLDWTTFTFANVDLSVVFDRPPEGEWLAMDARTHLGDRGAGTCVATLSDARGRVGTSTQALFVATR